MKHVAPRIHPSTVRTIKRRKERAYHAGWFDGANDNEERPPLCHVGMYALGYLHGGATRRRLYRELREETGP